MIVGVPAEVKTAECRVAITPDGVRELTALGHQVLVETGAGIGLFAQRRGLRDRWGDARRRGHGLVGGARLQGERATGVRALLPAPRPRAVHLPAPRGLPGRRQGAARVRDDRDRLRDRAAPLGRPASPRSHERGRGTDRDPGRRPLPRSLARYPGHPPRRRPRRAAGARRRDRRRPRRLELGLDRPGHGGRGPAAGP